MYRESKLKCPFLEGDPEGVRCCARNDFIRNIADSDMKLCVSRHYEVCSIYFSELRTSASCMALNAG